MGVQEYQQLVIDKFTEGMVDEEQLSRVQFPETSCVEAENVHFSPAGTLTKRPGYDNLNSTAWLTSAKIVKLYSFTTTGSPGTEYALAFCTCAAAASASIASIETTGVGSSVASFNSVQGTGAPGSAWAAPDGTVVSVCTYGGTACFTHWDNTYQPSFWAGDTATANVLDMTTAIPSGVRVMTAFYNYLMLGNVLDSTSIRRGSRVQWNTSATLSAWPASNWIDLDADDGDEITAMALFGNSIIVWKKYKMYALHYTGSYPEFQWERVSSTIGCLGPNAWIDSGGTLYFIGAYGFYSWEGRGEPTSIGDKIQTQIDDMNVAYGKTFDVDSDDACFEIWFFVATGTSTTKNVVFVYDTRFKSWTRFKFTDTMYHVGGISYGVTETYAHKPNAYSTYSTRIQDAKSNKEGVMVLAGAGYIYEYGAANADNDQDFTGYWLSRWLDFGMPHSNKRLIRVTTFLERESASEVFHLDSYIDWNTAITAVACTATLSGNVSYPMIEKRIEFTKAFRSIQFKIYTDSKDEPFTLHRVIVDYVPKGKTLVS